MATPERTQRWRRRIYEILEVGREDDILSQRVDRLLIVLILLNALVFAAETVPALHQAYGGWFHVFEVSSTLIFTLEYALRLWSCVEIPHLRRLSPWRARLLVARRAYLIIDLLAILPFYLSYLLPVDLRILRVLRLFRLLKLARYSPALHALMEVLGHERRALAGAGLLMMGMLLFSATGMYLIEREAQPDVFGTIPDAAWWAMATLTTVGYGDVAPITPLGKLFGSVVMLLGLGMFALPIAIIATGFSQELRRRDFVVTWPLLSRIPVLSELEPRDALDLMPHLRATDFPPHWDVAAMGDEAACVYFIASGRVRQRAAESEETLDAGAFFGEDALLGGGRHQFGYTTASRVRVLELHRRDFLRFEHAHPETARRIREAAQEAHRRLLQEGEARSPAEA